MVKEHEDVAGSHPVETISLLLNKTHHCVSFSTACLAIGEYRSLGSLKSGRHKRLHRVLIDLASLNLRSHWWRTRHRLRQRRNCALRCTGLDRLFPYDKRKAYFLSLTMMVSWSRRSTMSMSPFLISFGFRGRLRTTTLMRGGAFCIY